MKQKTKSNAAKTKGNAITLPDNAAHRQKTGSGVHTPRPLGMHLYITAFLMSAAAWPWANKPEYREKVMRVLSGFSDDMKAGLQKYQGADARAERVQQTPIWDAGSSTLLRYPAGQPGKKIPVLLVPSLINRIHILDLDADHSFTRFLVDAGYDVYTLDWGAPSEAEAGFSINDYITQRLILALETLQQKTGQSAHVIGYCMGGTIAAGAVSILEKQMRLVRSLTMLAAPWDFHAGTESIKLRTQAFMLQAEGVMTAKGVLPVDWIQIMFASIDPLFAFNKFRTFAAMDPTSEEARRFVIVEDWLNDGVDLTANAARQALQEWYTDNQPAFGVWSIGNRLVDANRIAVPVLVVAASGDRLVPEASARGFMQGNAGVTVISPDAGHIGMMASDRAVADVWQPIAAWLAQK